MSPARNAVAAVLRGPAAARLLGRFGIDGRQYWLLVDLFSELSDRHEMLNQLGRDGLAIKLVAGIYGAIAVLISVVMVAFDASREDYLTTLLVITGFLLLTILIAEAGNSLMNAAEALVLAQHPINGATYTAAKLSHLLRIVVYLVLAWNLLPALVGLRLTETGPWYPFLHIGAAFAVGLVIAFACCGVYGWLLRVVPPARMKTAAQIADVLPWLAFASQRWLRDLYGQLAPTLWTPLDTRVKIAIATVFAVCLAGLVVLGLRSLSADYLVRVTTMTRSAARRDNRIRHSSIGELVGRLCGGPPGRAGFEYVGHMLLRDWQYRKQLIPLVVPVIPLIIAMIREMPVSPFSGKLTPFHFWPHVIGGVLCVLCAFLSAGADCKGTWVFLAAPAGVLDRFARGVHGLLWGWGILVPYTILLPFACWQWGWSEGLLYNAFSAAVSSTYLAAGLRLIGAVPFSKDLDPSRGSILMPVFIAGGLIIAISVGFQHFFLFRSTVSVAAATVLLACAAGFLTWSSVSAFAETMRYQLSLESKESGKLYVEV